MTKQISSSVKNGPAYLPGDRSSHAGHDSLHREIANMIRVDHAGEYGARRIYEGQIDALKHSDEHTRAELQHMYAQELEHLSYFENELVKRKMRPSLFMPIWHIAGYALGRLTGTISKEAAMACTVAVETEIEKHYQEQLDKLKNYDCEADLSEKIKKFQQEEVEHHDKAIEQGAKQARYYDFLTMTIQQGARLAIKIAKF